jgi:hypothetical protein
VVPQLKSGDSAQPARSGNAYNESLEIAQLLLSDLELFLVFHKDPALLEPVVWKAISVAVNSSL